MTKSKRIVHVSIGTSDFPMIGTDRETKRIFADIRRLVKKSLLDAGVTRDTGVLVTNHTVNVRVYDMEITT
jgi:hypothetical protein